MPSFNHSDPATLMGRFIVHFEGATQTGVAAHEVLEYLNDEKTPVRDVFQIHRVDEEGRMELVGLAREDLKIPGGILVLRETVKDAREVYDDLLESAVETPPPCRVDMRLSRLSDPSRFGVALLFPSVCTDAVMHWLARLDITTNGVSAGTGALVVYREGSPNDILSTTLES